MTIDAPELRAAAREAIRLSFEELLAAHPGERFYAFALYTDDGVSGISPAANSEEGLATKIAEYGEDAEPNYLRWTTSEWSYEGFGWDRTKDVYHSIMEMPGRDDDFDAFYAGVLTLMEGVIADLDAEGLFGRGTEREGVTLLCTITDSDEALAYERRTVRALNPQAAAARYEADLEE